MADYTVAFSGLDNLLSSLTANTASNPYSISITGLTAANIEDGYQTGTLGDKLYYLSDKYLDLSETEFPSGLTNCYRTFYGDKTLIISPTIPSTVTNLAQAFYNNQTLKTVTLNIRDFTNVNVSRIFEKCSVLESVYVPSAAAKNSLINKLTAGTDYPSGLDMNSIIKVTAESVEFNDLNTYLQNKETNTVQNPYSIDIVGLRRRDLRSSEISGTLGYILKQNPTKYVDLSGTSLFDKILVLDDAFNGCVNLIASPSIPSKVESIIRTFYGCVNLTTAPTIPDSVTNIKQTFYGCTSLTAIPSLPDNLTNMEEAFKGCTSLVTPNSIPNNVINMKGTFSGCTSLTTMWSIPSAVINMEETFYNCTALTTAPSIPSSATNIKNIF